MNFSVVIPFYNSGKYLKLMLESIVAQDATPTQIVIVNDGSDEGESLAALDEMEALYGNVVVLHQENVGISGALNTGFKHATGEVIFALDADDLLCEGYFERYMDTFVKYPEVDVVVSGYKSFFTELDPTNESSFHKFFMPIGLKEPDIYFYNCGGGANIAIRSSKVKEMDYFNVSFSRYQDWGFFLKCLEFDCNVRVIEEYLYCYRIHRQGDNQKRGSSKDRNKLVLAYLRETFSDFADMSFDQFELRQAHYIENSSITKNPSSLSLGVVKQQFLKGKYYISKIF